MLAIGIIFAQAEEGKGKIIKNNGNCILLEDYISTESVVYSLYEVMCLYDCQYVNAEECIHKNYDCHHLGEKTDH